MKNLSVISLIIVLAIIGVVAYISVKSNISTVKGKTFVIEVNDEGFYPKEVKIGKNDKVKFINKASKDIWPASDLHPTHTVYPEFDPKKRIKPSESWQFDFQKIGFWYFHDHLRPNIKGLVIVADNKSFADLDELRKKCPQGTDPDSTCLEEAIRKMVRDGQVAEAFDLIEARYKAAAGGASACHGLTHIIGEETYYLFAKEVDFDISPKSAYCAYGFYHGFMERLVSETKDLRKASEFCKVVDQKLASFASDTQLQCYHGIGHGTATAHDPKVEGDEWAILTPALKLCEKVSETGDQLYRCASGAFNAIALYYIDGEYNLPLNRKDPLKLCHKQEDRFKDSCYGNMNTLLSWMSNDDLAKSAPFIEEIADDNYAISAIKYLSAIIASRNVDKTDRLVNLCRALQKRLRVPCVIGIVHGIIEHGKPGIEYIEALKFCRSSILKEEERLVCFNQAVNYFHSIYPKEKVAEVCTGIEQRYSDPCKRGN